MAISGIADLVELLCLYKFDDFQKSSFSFRFSQYSWSLAIKKTLRKMRIFENHRICTSIMIPQGRQYPKQPNKAQTIDILIIFFFFSNAKHLFRAYIHQYLSSNPRPVQRSYFWLDLESRYTESPHRRQKCLATGSKRNKKTQAHNLKSSKSDYV